MKSRAVITTKEQKEYCDSILGRRPRRKEKVITKTSEPKITTREEYMKNCLYWINEYLEGRANKEMLKTASFHLTNYCDEILNPHP